MKKHGAFVLLISLSLHAEKLDQVDARGGQAKKQFEEKFSFLIEAEKQFEKKFPSLLDINITLINIVTPTFTTKAEVRASRLAAVLKVWGLNAYAHNYITATSNPHLSIGQIKEAFISALNDQNNYAIFSDIAAFLSMDTESFLSAFIDAIKWV